MAVLSTILGLDAETVGPRVNLVEGEVNVNGSGWSVLPDGTLQEILDANDTALLNARSTGTRFGGNLTDQGAGVVRIAPGAGQILDNTDPENPTYAAFTWTQTDIDLSAADDVYFVYVDSAGAVQSTTVEPGHSEYRTSVWLWRISIRGGVVSGTSSIVQPSQQYGPQLWDLFRAIGFIKRGMTLMAGGADLTVAHAAGEVYQPGAGFYAHPTNPHEIDIAAQSPATFRHVDQNGVQTPDRTTLDVANYDIDGVDTPIPGSGTRAQIFTWKKFPGSNNDRIFKGQSWFTSVEEARAALASGAYGFTAPASYDNAITMGWIIAEKSATDLTDGTQVFITANRFGGTGGSVSTAGTAFQPILAEGPFVDGDKTKLDTLSTGDSYAAAGHNHDGQYQAVGDYVKSDPTGVTGATAITNMMKLTQAEYDAIPSPDAATLYVIVG